MLYGLAASEGAFSRRLDKAILLSPCLYKEDATMEAYQAVWPVFRAEGVNQIGLPYRWDQDKQNICNPSSSDALLAENRELACEFANYMQGEADPVKDFEYFSQIQIAGRFQEYIPDFGPESKFSARVGSGLENIATVPIQIVQNKNDALCPTNMTNKLRDEIGGAV